MQNNTNSNPVIPQKLPVITRPVKFEAKSDTHSLIDVMKQMSNILKFYENLPHTNIDQCADIKGWAPVHNSIIDVLSQLNY